jgi:hypothetical protein
MDCVWSLVAGGGIAVSGLPLVRQRESHKARVVVESFVAQRGILAALSFHKAHLCLRI